MYRFIALCSVALVCVSALPALRAQEVVAIRAGRIIIGGADEIRDGVLLIRQGKIIDVGKDVKVPFDATVHSFPGGVVVPGLVECHSTAGLRSSNEVLPDVPYISVMDGIDPNSRSFADALRDGITAIHVIPGNSTRIGGQGAVLRPFGPTVDAMVIKTPSAMKISLQPSAGATRMTHMAALRKTFFDLHGYLQGLVPKGPGELIAGGRTGSTELSDLLVPKTDWKGFDFAKVPAEKIDEQKRPLVDLVRGKMTAFIYCPRASDIFKALELMDQHGIRGTLVLGSDADRAADALAARQDLGPVILDPALERIETDPDTGKERRYRTARRLHDAGIRFAVSARTSSSSGPWIFSKEGSYHLWYQAAKLVQQGIPRREALRSITLYPARILGLDHRLGTLEKGRDASFSIFTGDPLDVRSWVDRVFIEGREVYRRDQDRELKELLRKPEKGF